MIHSRRPAPWTRTVALSLAVAFVVPTLSGCGSKEQAPASNTVTTAAPMNTPGGPMNAPRGPMPNPNGTMNNAPMQKQGMSTGKKAVIVLAGAALLYYLYKKHQAQQQASGNSAAGQQLYQSSNGGIYYRDAQHRPVWVTAPAQQMQVPASDVQQYAPDYSQYQGRPAPPAPAGYRTQSFSQLDPSMAAGSMR